MKIIKILFALFIFTTFSCKNEKKQIEVKEEKKVVKKNNDSKNLNLYFDGVFDFKDNVILYFDDEVIANDSIVRQAKKMPNNWQRLEFMFPSETVPYSFKIKISKKTHTTIKYDKIVLNRQNDRIIIKDSTLLVYFDLVNIKHSFNGEKLFLQKRDTLLESYLVSKKNLNDRIINRYGIKN